MSGKNLVITKIILAEKIVHKIRSDYFEGGVQDT